MCSPSSRSERNALWPDTSLTSFDKINVRRGDYTIFGPLHLLAKVSSMGGDPTNPVVKLIMNYFTGKADPPGGKTQLIDLEIKNYTVPQCAMYVKRSTEMGPLTPYTPDVPCHCYFEKKATGTAPSSCKSCVTDADAPVPTWFAATTTARRGTRAPTTRNFEPRSSLASSSPAQACGVHVRRRRLEQQTIVIPKPDSSTTAGGAAARAGKADRRERAADDRRRGRAARRPAVRPAPRAVQPARPVDLPAQAGRRAARQAPRGAAVPAAPRTAARPTPAAAAAANARPAALMTTACCRCFPMVAYLLFSHRPLSTSSPATEARRAGIRRRGGVDSSLRGDP